MKQSARGGNSISRRRFLGAAGAVAAAPLFVPRTAFGANNKINMGVIGIGKQGEFHVRQLRHHPDVKIVAVADVYRQFRELGQGLLGGAAECAGYNDFRELLARKDIDAVLIATPDHWHAIPAIEAARAGKDIYCEKPLSLTVHEAREMVKATRRYNRVFQTGSQQRSGAEFRRACELVRNGYIGKLKEIRIAVGGPSVECHLPAEPVPAGMDWDLWLGPAPVRPFNAVLRPPHNDTYPNWRAYRDYSGGGMTDWGAHHFDIAQWALDMDNSGPVQVIPPDGKEVKNLTYIYANGIPMYKMDGPGVTFVGSEGEIIVNRGRLDTTPASLRTLAPKPGDIRLYDSKDHHRDWLDCIRTRQRPICDVEVGCRTVTVCHIGNIAFRLGRPLKWDPAAERFINDDMANRMLHRAYREPWQLG